MIETACKSQGWPKKFTTLFVDLTLLTFLTVPSTSLKTKWTSGPTWQDSSLLSAEFVSKESLRLVLEVSTTRKRLLGKILGHFLLDVNTEQIEITLLKLTTIMHRHCLGNRFFLELKLAMDRSKGQCTQFILLKKKLRHKKGLLQLISINFPLLFYKVE
jgi:hypothetical protein